MRKERFHVCGCQLPIFSMILGPSGIVVLRDLAVYDFKTGASEQRKSSTSIVLQRIDILTVSCPNLRSLRLNLWFQDIPMYMRAWGKDEEVEEKVQLWLATQEAEQLLQLRGLHDFRLLKLEHDWKCPRIIDLRKLSSVCVIN